MSMTKAKDIGFGLWKYVVFSDGSVAFCDACNPWASHKGTIINEMPEKAPVSAGTIRVTYDGEWHIKEQGSTTAGLHGGENDEDVIAAALPHLRFNHELMYQ